jgi:hypothetical protein
MASITPTIILPPHVEPPLRIALHPREVPLDERIAILFRLLSGTEIWSPEAKEKITRWIARFVEEFLPQLGSAEGVKKAIFALCHLLTSTIRPEIGALQGQRASQLELAKVELAVKAVLEALLPQGLAPERFIAQFESGERIRKIKELKLVLRCEAFQALSLNQEEKFQALKASLLELNTNRKAMKAELQAKVTTLTNEILRLCSMLSSLSSEVAATAEALGRYEEQFQSLIRECEHLCHEVQRL